MSSSTPPNPLLAPWSGPHGGLPPFASVQTSHFLPAITESIASFHADLSAIASSPAPPTFANTMEAYCSAGKALEAASAIYSTWSSVMSTPEFQAVETQVEPLLAAARDVVFQNSALFSRIKALHDDASARAALAPEQARLLEVTFTKFKRRGALLSDAEKPEVAAINQVGRRAPAPPPSKS
jgi:peptidyl-dipeptidase Dcp